MNAYPIKLWLVPMPADAGAGVVLRAENLGGTRVRPAKRLDPFDHRNEPDRYGLRRLEAASAINRNASRKRLPSYWPN